MPLRPHQRARLQATFACLGALALRWRLGGILPLIIACLAGALALLAWSSPACYAPVQRALDRMLHTVLSGFTWLLLAVVYFAFFTPLRAWRSLRRRDPLQLRPAPGAATFLHPLPPASPVRFDRQF